MRYLLLPFSLLYGLLISLRNFFYDKGWLRSFEFDFPVILVGNLNTGGTGKTPHVEYLIHALRQKYKIATLSRGYKRKLRGYALATQLSLVEDIGDEPKQYMQKFPDIEVCVSEDRVKGVYSLLQDAPDVNVIIMDDGMQHRRIKPGLQIMLTAFDKLFYKDIILPAGNLREPKNGSRRAHIILVTKCPADLDQTTAEKIRSRIKKYSGAQIFFTTQVYDALQPLFADMKSRSNSEQCLFVSGIANNRHALAHLKNSFSDVKPMAFRDHHYFTENDIRRIALHAKNAMVITTEKDAMRLMEQEDMIRQNELHIFILPVKVEFLFNASAAFDALITNYITTATPVVDIS